MFLEEYAEPGDELERWRSKPPPEFKGSYTKWKKTLAIRCYPFVRLSKKDVRTPQRNLENRARQFVAFCTRIKPIHLILWQILLNRGVSTFCHLEGVPDKDALQFITMVNDSSNLSR